MVTNTEIPAAVLQEICSLLREQLRFQRLSALHAIRERAAQELDDDDCWRVLEASVGSKSTREVSKVTQLSDWKVRQVWRRLAATGLMHEDPAVAGRYVPSFTLEELRCTLGKHDE
jgi:hypothetical protein